MIYDVLTVQAWHRRWRQSGRRERSWIIAEAGPGSLGGGTGLTAVLGGAVGDSLAKLGARARDWWAGRSASPEYRGANPNVVVWRLDGGRTLAAASEGPDGEVLSFDRRTLRTASSVRTMARPRGVIQTAAHYFEQAAGNNLHVAMVLQQTGGQTGVLSFRVSLAVFRGDSAPFRAIPSASNHDYA